MIFSSAPMSTNNIKNSELIDQKIEGNKPYIEKLGIMMQPPKMRDTQIQCTSSLGNSEHSDEPIFR